MSETDEGIIIEAPEEASEAISSETPPTEPTPEGEQEKTPTLEEKLAAAEQSAAHQSLEARQAKRRADESEAENARLKAESESPKGERPVIPEFPDDPYADSYQQDLESWKTGSQAAAEYDANVKVLGELETDRANAQAEANATAVREAGEKFQKQGLELGISDAEMLQNATKVGNAGVLTPDEAAYLLGDELGPLKIKLLAENPVLFEQFASQPPGLTRGTFLTTTLNEQAAAIKANDTKAPDPLLQVEQGGTGPGMGLEGITFE